MRALKLFRRVDDRPTLKDRAAALKARLARIARRPDDADPSRRIMVAGSLAAAFPLPTLAARAIPAGPHPDQVVLDAEAALLAAEQAYRAANATFNAAYDACWREIGPCPPELLLRDPDEDRGTFTTLLAPLCVRRDAPQFQFISGVGEAWTADGLRRALRHAVVAYGRGGRTPFRCRRYRALLPIAEAFDARRSEAEERFQIETLAAASRAADAAQRAAWDAMSTTPATTTTGLAAIARQARGCGWERMPPNWRNLLVSAANVSGVELRDPTESARG